ncbi:SRPBCC domain-containing protein [Flavobacterium terrisoli]|uniref:SRPBCC domain-containing protein n=1 Tax=Flavobacterium terrisoli TaxID=3242195 RepID=UPI002542D423|nr:SRPBCC domain-containing protein [Flavobacterium buctense]
MTASVNNTADREIIISRLLNGPIELVWEVWTNPDHIKHWWGPSGFTNTITKMEVVPNGLWNLVMHGPDGTDYDNESVFTEVVWHKKIMYHHISGHEFIAAIQFEERGNQTFIHWQMLFETKEELNRIMALYDISEGLKQNVDKLEAYLKNQK